MHSADYLVFFIQIVVLLTAAKLLGEAFRRFHQPAVVGELMAGIVLGPTLLGAMAPDLHRALFPTPEGHLLPPALDALTMLGVTLLMLAAGLEVDLGLLVAQRRATFLCAIFGSAVPLALGVAAGLALGGFWRIPAGIAPLAFAIVLGINLAMSALPVIAKTLIDLGIHRTRVGTVILSAAMVDDLGVWILFSVSMSLATGGAHGRGPWATVILTVLLLVLVLGPLRLAVDRHLPFLQEEFAWPGTLIAFTVTVGIGLAAVALWIGVHPVFGSLLAGVAIGSARNLRPGSKEVIYEFVLSVFAPIFFASIGLRMNFVRSFDLAIVSAVLLLGCAGKLLGAGLGARLAGLDWRESGAVAVGLNSRGIMGIVLGLVALEAGIIEDRMFVALAILGISTSLVSGPILRLLAAPSAARSRAAGREPTGCAGPTA